MPGWNWCTTGHGHGMQLSNGHLAVTCDYSTGCDVAQYSAHLVLRDHNTGLWTLDGDYTLYIGPPPPG